MVRRTAVLAAAVVAAGLLVGCEVAPPPATFTVTTSADGFDASPGDGVCEVTPGAGNCSLRAAVAEANALGAGDISLPDDSYALTAADPADGDADLDNTGRVTITGTGDAPPHINSSASRAFDIAPGARLNANRLTVDSYSVAGLVRVAGDAVLDQVTVLQSALFVAGAEPAVRVLPTGALVLFNSALVGTGGPAAVDNQGTLVAAYSSIDGMYTPGLATGPGATSTVAASTLSSLVLDFRTPVESPTAPACSGSPITSLGYNRVPNASCGLSAPTDQVGPDTTFVDLVPVGILGCGDQFDVDLRGSARPREGNGDGVDGCDAGHFEAAGPLDVRLQPVTATVGQCYAGYLGPTNVRRLQWTVTGLPPGLTVQGNLIRGIPTTSGTFPVEVTLRAPSGGGTLSTTLTVAPGVEPWATSCD